MITIFILLFIIPPLFVLCIILASLIKHLFSRRKARHQSLTTYSSRTPSKETITFPAKITRPSEPQLTVEAGMTCPITGFYRLKQAPDCVVLYFAGQTMADRAIDRGIYLNPIGKGVYYHKATWVYIPLKNLFARLLPRQLRQKN